MMQTQSESPNNPVFTIALIGFMGLSLSSCCLFSPRKTDDDHHAAVANQTASAVQAPIKTTAHQNHLICADKLHPQRSA